MVERMQLLFSLSDGSANPEPFLARLDMPPYKAPVAPFTVAMKEIVTIACHLKLYDYMS